MEQIAEAQSQIIEEQRKAAERACEILCVANSEPTSAEWRARIDALTDERGAALREVEELRRHIGRVEHERDAAIEVSGRMIALRDKREAERDAARAANKALRERMEEALTMVWESPEKDATCACSHCRGWAEGSRRTSERIRVFLAEEAGSNQEHVPPGIYVLRKQRDTQIVRAFTAEAKLRALRERVEAVCEDRLGDTKERCDDAWCRGWDAATVGVVGDIRAALGEPEAEAPEPEWMDAEEAKERVRVGMIVELRTPVSHGAPCVGRVSHCGPLAIHVQTPRPQGLLWGWPGLRVRIIDEGEANGDA